MREQNRISLGAIMATVLLIVAGMLLYFYHLGKTDFASEPPARVALYARQMNLNNEWLAPTLRNQVRVDVPPFYLWTVKLVSGLSPDLGAYETRLPGSVSALLLILLAAWWMYVHASRYGREDMAESPTEGAALLAGLIVAANPILFSVGRDGTLHSMFALAYGLAAYCWGESLEARRSYYAGRSWKSWILWGYALAGLAMLIRGPLVLPLLLVPYWLASRSYHLRRLDPVHLAGFAMALVIGMSWPVLITIYHPEVAAGLWREWLSLHFGNLDAHTTEFYKYLYHVIGSSTPWIILAAVLSVRVWQKKDRSPTLVFWVCSLIGNLIVLTFMSAFVGQHRLPVVLFISLLAADSLHRWNFENAWAVAWRVVLRIFLVLAIAAGIFCSILLNSPLGISLFGLLIVGWGAWVIYSRKQELQFTPWETTIRLSAMTVLVIFAVEGILLTNWEPRRLFLKERLTYFKRVKTHLPKHERQLFLAQRGMSVLYDYYLQPQPVMKAEDVAFASARKVPTYFFTDRDLTKMVQNPRLDPETFYWEKDLTAPDEGLFKVLPEDGVTTLTAAQRLARRHPLRVVAIGNSGTRTGDSRDVARQIYQHADTEAIDDVLMLGNNIYGPSLFRHLSFVKSFERPYLSLLKQGVRFHALLGHEDQSYAWLQTHYPPFHMGGQRYYVQSLHGGLVDFFALDSETLYTDKKLDEAQMSWLEQALAGSKATWKVVGLNQALVSGATNIKPAKELADRLLPLFDKYRVNFVLWAGGFWYERLSLPGHLPVFLNGGWSGDSKEAKFGSDPNLKVGYDHKAGFILLEFNTDRAGFKAIQTKGGVVDKGVILLNAPAGAAARVPALGAADVPAGK